MQLAGDERIRILVTQVETRGALAAVRGLHKAGFLVTAALGPEPTPARWSRCVDERLSVPPPITDEPAFIDAIAGAVSYGTYGALVPGGEASLIACSRGRHLLEPHIRIGLPSHDAVKRSTDRQALTEAASHNGLSAPQTIACSNLDHAVEVAGDIGFPVLIKPLRSVVEGAGNRHQVGSVLVEDEPSLRSIAPRFGDPFLLQRVEPGAILSFAGVLADGRLIGEALSRYARTWRPEAGNVSFSQTVEIPQPLREHTIAVLQEIGWEGLFELELIERSDGGWSAIDLNPRIYGSLALAIGAGANLPAIWCEHLLGREPGPVSARPGVCYRWEDGDLRHAMWKLRHGGMSAAAPVLHPGRSVVHPFFERSDPWPFVAHALSMSKAGLRRARASRQAGRARATLQAGRARATRQSGGARAEAGRTATTPRLIPRRPAGRDEPIVIIGAGPYGLAAAAHLRAAGLPIRCFGEPLEFWRKQMPKGMVLRSRRRSTHISDPEQRFSIDRYELAEGTKVRSPSLLLEEFVDYGLWFQRQVVPDVDTRRVQSVARHDGRFQLRLADGEELGASRVVVAGGLFPFARRPEVFSSLSPGLVSHTSEHDDLGVFTGKHVAVVGQGQSALESAALLNEHQATVEVLGRAPAIRWLADDGEPPTKSGGRISVPLPPTDVGGRLSGWLAATPDAFRRTPRDTQQWVSHSCIRPMGSGWLRPRLEAVRISGHVSVVACEERDGRAWLLLSDRSERTVDHVLLGTGYSIEIVRYPFLAPELAAEIKASGGYPLLGPGLESSVAGLHFLGAPAAFSFGPIMRFVVGTWYAAPALARRAQGRHQPPVRFAFPSRR